jgi:hypothetical protein
MAGGPPAPARPADPDIHRGREPKTYTSCRCCAHDAWLHGVSARPSRMAILFPASGEGEAVDDAPEPARMPRLYASGRLQLA